MSAVLQVEGLRVAYGGTEIVRGVDLTVRAGRKVGIVGESGSGKSTLALAILGLLGRDGTMTGSVQVSGTELVGLPQRRLDAVRGKDLSLVFQDPLTSLDPVKTVGSQIGEVLKRHDRRLSRPAARARAAELLTSVGVADAAARLDAYPHQFSGGMRQRVLIAIAVANQPAVLVADEPTTALDVTTQAQVVEVFDRLVDELGVAVVLITHDLGVVAEFCDEVHVMYAGRMVEHADVRTLFGAPAHPYTRALLDSLPVPGRSRADPLRWIPGAPPQLDALPSGCAFAPRCASAIGACSSTRPVPVQIEGAVDHEAECLLVPAGMGSAHA